MCFFITLYRQKALNNFIEKSSSQADLRSRSRQRSRTPGPSRPIQRPESRQRASSEPRARSKSREGRRPTNKQPRVRVYFQIIHGCYIEMSLSVPCLYIEVDVPMPRNVWFVNYEVYHVKYTIKIQYYKMLAHVQLRVSCLRLYSLTFPYINILLISCML